MNLKYKQELFPVLKSKMSVLNGIECHPPKKSKIISCIQSLDNLPSALKNGEFECVDHHNGNLFEGEEVAKEVIRGNYSVFETSNWKQSRFNIRVQLLIEKVEKSRKSPFSKTDDQLIQRQLTLLDEEGNMTLCLDLLHIAVITIDVTMFEKFTKLASIDVGNVKSMMENLVSLIEPEKTEEDVDITVAEENSWIIDASCYHLAAKFNPRALNVLLSCLKNKAKDMEIIYENGRTSPMHVAAFNSNTESVCIQLIHDAPYDCTDCKDYTPMFYACKAGSLEVIHELNKYGAKINHQSINTGKTPIFRARTEETVNLLLKFGAQTYVKSNEGITAIEYLMKYNPCCSRAILDNCLSRQQDDLLILDFHVFDQEDHDSNDNEMKLFQSICDENRSDLLLHPLMQIFMSLKTRSFWYQFWSQFLFQLFCASLITAFAVLYTDLIKCEDIPADKLKDFTFHKHDVTITNQTCFQFFWENNVGYGCQKNEILSTIYNSNKKIIRDDWPIKCVKKSLIPTLSKNNQTELDILFKAMGYKKLEDSKKWWFIHYGIIILLCIILLREFHEVCYDPWNYIKTRDNYLQLMAVMFMILFLCFHKTNLNLAQHFAAWMVYFIWIDLTLLFGELDKIGQCVYMTIDVLKTMALVFSIYIPSYFAYSFGFYILIHPMESFNSYSGAIVKVLAMSIGELDYTANFDYHIIQKEGGRNHSAQLMMVAFIFTMALIMMNVLLAVTLNKTEDLENKSKIMQMKKRIHQIKIAHALKNSRLYHPILTRCGIAERIFKTIDKTNKMCIKTDDGPSYGNKIRKFLRMDSMKKIFFYEYGKLVKEDKSFMIPEPLYNMALKLVKENELKAIEFEKDMKNAYQNSAFKLNRAKIYAPADCKEDDFESHGDVENRLISLEQKLDLMENKLQSIIDVLCK